MIDLEYWLQWQVGVTAIIILIPVIISIRFLVSKNNTRTTTIDNHLWMPCFGNLHPIWLLLYRLFAFTFMAYLLYLTYLSRGLDALYFFTQWTFILVTVYLALGILISAHGCWIYYSKSHSLSNQEAGFWGNLMQNIYVTCAGAVILVDITFWGVLLPARGDFKLTPLFAGTHSLNAVFLILDFGLNSVELTWHRLTYFILYASTYIVFQWVAHACCVSWWPYHFLKLATPWAPLWYLSFVLLFVPCYGIYIFLVKAKFWVLSKMFPRTFMRMVVNEKKM